MCVFQFSRPYLFFGQTQNILLWKKEKKEKERFVQTIMVGHKWVNINVFYANIEKRHLPTWCISELYQLS